MFKDIINQMFLNNMLNVFEFWRLFLLFCFSLCLSKLLCLNYHFYILPFDFVSTQMISALSISVIFVAFLYRILISFHKCLFNIQSVFSVRKTIASCNVTFIFIFLTKTVFLARTMLYLIDNRGQQNLPIAELSSKRSFCVIPCRVFHWFHPTKSSSTQTLFNLNVLLSPTLRSFLPANGCNA